MIPDVIWETTDVSLARQDVATYQGRAHMRTEQTDRRELIYVYNVHNQRHRPHRPRGPRLPHHVAQGRW